ncbi:cytochrome c oxidase subunit 1, partial [Lobulomyces angularis]
ARRLRADDIFEYNTQKVVTIKDYRLGVLYASLTMGVVGYVSFQIWNQQLFLKKSTPIGGTVVSRLSFLPLENKEIPDYCSSPNKCLFWSANQVTFSENNDKTSLSVTTSIKTQTIEVPANCTLLSSTTPDYSCAPTYNPLLSTTFLIANVEKMQIRVDHSFLVSNNPWFFLPYSYSYNSQSNVAKKIEGRLLYCGLTDNAALNYTLPGTDIFTVQQLMENSFFCEKDYEPDIRKRLTSGAIVSCPILYTTTPESNDDYLTYDYSPFLIAKSTFSTLQTLTNANGSVTFIERIGILINFSQTGQIGKFDFMTLLVNMTATFTLLRIITFIVDSLMLYTFPRKNVYQRAKFETTEEFGDFELKKKKSNLTDNSSNIEYTDDSFINATSEIHVQNNFLRVEDSVDVKFRRSSIQHNNPEY